jgi:hypothetical protein
MPKQTKKTTAKPAKSPKTPNLLQKSATLRTLAGSTASAGCQQKVLACIGQQSGGRDLSGNPTLGAIGVQGFLLAGCINQAFNLSPPDAFTASDFPPTMKVLVCIDLVCSTVDPAGP